MKRLIRTATFLLTFALFSAASAQTSGVLWIKTFEPGSTSLNDPGIDHDALAALDQLMKRSNIEVTFLGAADSVGWVMNGRSVHTHISEAWNDAKRLGRARALRARYERGHVGITHENIAGVKVIWSRKVSREQYKKEFTEIKDRNENLDQKLAQLEDQFQKLHPLLEAKGDNGSNGHVAIDSHSYFDWFLQGGFWTWQSGSGGSLISPSIALGIIINNTSFILQGGVTPWHISTSQGNQSESFVFVGIKHMKSRNLGLTVGVFRGWEFFTDTDDWSFKTTGLSSGIVFKKGIFEFSPMVSYSNSNSIFQEPKWKIGTTLGVAINFNEAF
ncbi:MAG: hypothetical protein ACE5IY_19120 [bacterium]